MTLDEFKGVLLEAVRFGERLEHRAVERHYTLEKLGEHESEYVESLALRLVGPSGLEVRRES